MMKLDARRSGLVLSLFAAACNHPEVVSAKGGGNADGGTRDGSHAAAPDGGFGFSAIDGGNSDGAAPVGESCAKETQTARLLPVDLLLLLDASGSMAELAGTRSRWEMARDALVGFLGDPRSAGLGVGLQLFPLHTFTCQDDGDCFLPSPGGCLTFSACLAPGAPLASGQPCGGPEDDLCPAPKVCVPMGRCSASGGDCVGMGQPCKSGMAGDTCGPRPRQCRIGPHARGSCTNTDYQKLMVPIGDLPAASGRLTGAMDTRLPVGGTPLAPAVRGAVAHLMARLTTNPGRRAALVIVSDGVPSGCGEVAEIAADLSAASGHAPPIPTYAVGVFTDGDPDDPRTTMQTLATAGGTGAPFIISATDQLTQKFLDALSQIRGAALPCELEIPTPASGELDYGKVNVHVEGGAGPVDLTYVASSDRCALAPNGWYYDADPATAKPTHVRLCPAVCDRLKSDAKASVELRFGCKSKVIQ
jgi:hypothetical protein